MLAAHQPNFIPYMGYFYKMYVADTFVISDNLQFSKSQYQNFNYIRVGSKVHKITVPVTNRSNTINKVRLHDWKRWSRKIFTTVSQAYTKSPFYETMMETIATVFDKDFTHLIDLNLTIIDIAKTNFNLPCSIEFESSMGIRGETPTDQIADICSKLSKDTYLSGLGAKSYLDTTQLERQGITVKWSNYTSSNILSVIDYVANHGWTIPEEWEVKKEELLND